MDRRFRRTQATPWRFLLALLLGTLSVGLLYGSIDRGSIRGTVTDPQGAAVVGATVVVRNVATNVETTLKTNQAGFYVATQLVPGNYAVRVSAAGFTPLDIKNLTVTANETTTADAELKLGGTAQTVEVSAAPQLVDSTPANFSTVLQGNQVAELPIQGRDIQALVQLIPGITQSSGPSGTLFGFNSEFGGFPDPLHFAGSNVSANGSQGSANVWYLDGNLNSSPMAQNVAINPSQDAIAEFNVVNNGLSAEWGRTNGAVFNVVLKSGTNGYHGDVYGFNRNSRFSATNPFAQRDSTGHPYLQPWVNWNDVGGTLGGPIRHDKTFFFVSYELSFLHEKKPTVLTVPLPQERAGNFLGDPRFAASCTSAGVTNCIYDPYTTSGPDSQGLFHRTPFSTPVIPANRIDPLAAFYVSTFPNPNFQDPLAPQCASPIGYLCNNFLGDVGSSLTTNNLSVKIDHEISQKHKFFGEWLYNPSHYYNYRYPWNGPTAPTFTGVEGAQPYDIKPNIITLGLTSTFTPSLVNEARVTFNRQAVYAYPNPDSVTGNSQVKQKVQGLNFILFSPFQDVPTVSIGGPQTNLGLPTFGVQEWQNANQGAQSFTILDNVMKVIGKHTLKTGFMFRRSSTWYADSWGYNLSFGGGLTQDPVTSQGGSGLAQFLLGATDQYSTYTGVYLETRPLLNYWAGFGQDDFRVTPNLSLNFGLRYEIIPSPFNTERHHLLANFDPFQMNPKVPFHGRVDYVGTPEHPGETLFPPHHNSLGPRFSFAWAPFGGQNTVIRGGAGIIYSSALEIGQGWGGQPTPTSVYIGYYGDYSGQRPAFRLSGGAHSILFQSPAQYIKTDEQYLGQGLNYYTLGSKDPYVEQYSFYVERQLPGATAVTAGYVGTHGLHLLGDLARTFNYVPTATRLALRNNLNSPVAVDPSLAGVYGCPTDPNTGKALCPGNLVLRQFPQYQNISLDLPMDGVNFYNSFQLKVEKRPTHGLDFLAAYTFQKNVESANFGSLIGNESTPAMWSQGAGRTQFLPGAASGGLAENHSGASGAPEDPDNRNLYRTLAPDDIPQMLNFQVNWDLPVGHNRRWLSSGALGSILGGWRWVQNWNFQSGVPLLFTAPCDGISCRPNLIGDPNAGRDSETRQQIEQQYFNPAAFEAPFGSNPAIIQAASTGTYPNGTPFDYNSDIWWHFGDVGARLPSARSPGFWDTDMSLVRDFHIGENRRLQARWDVFNALNHQSLGIPNTAWCLPPIQNPDGSVTTDRVHLVGCSFGRITNVQIDPRSMQFGLKFYF